MSYLYYIFFLVCLGFQAGAQLFSTGIAANSSLMTVGNDPHWTWSQGGTKSSPSASWMSLPVFRFVGFWVDPSIVPVTAAWTGSPSAILGWIAFKTTFNNSNNVSVLVSGLWGCDNNPGLILVNGVSFPTFSGTSFGTLSPFNFTAPPGNNTIVFTVYNTAGGYAGAIIAFKQAIAFCPAGSFSVTSSLIPLSVICLSCPAGTFFTPAIESCQKCPGGHFCPAGTLSWARLNCGRGYFCPEGSAIPTPCPFQVPPSGGWGALQVQGPAFMVETAGCLNQCFWNYTSGDGMLSKC
jgi:hypothetical protein